MGIGYDPLVEATYTGEEHGETEERAVNRRRDNAEDCTPEEIAAEIFEGITVEQVRRILHFHSINL